MKTYCTIGLPLLFLLQCQRSLIIPAAFFCTVFRHCALQVCQHCIDGFLCFHPRKIFHFSHFNLGSRLRQDPDCLCSPDVDFFAAFRLFHISASSCMQDPYHGHIPLILQLAFHKYRIMRCLSEISTRLVIDQFIFHIYFRSGSPLFYSEFWQRLQRIYGKYQFGKCLLSACQILCHNAVLSGDKCMPTEVPGLIPIVHNDLPGLSYHPAAVCFELLLWCRDPKLHPRMVGIQVSSFSAVYIPGSIHMQHCLSGLLQLTSHFRRSHSGFFCRHQQFYILIGQYLFIGITGTDHSAVSIACHQSLLPDFTGFQFYFLFVHLSSPRFECFVFYFEICYNLRVI